MLISFTFMILVIFFRSKTTNIIACYLRKKWCREYEKLCAFHKIFFKIELIFTYFVISFEMIYGVAVWDWVNVCFSLAMLR